VRAYGALAATVFPSLIISCRLAVRPRQAV